MAFAKCFTCFKYIVLLFNFLLWLLGCALLAVGAWLLMDDSAGRYVEQLTSTSPGGDESRPIISYTQVTDNHLPSTLAYLFIAFGLVIILVAFIGFCGAVRENQCFLGTFMLSLFLLFAVLMGIGIWAFVARADVQARTRQLQELTTEMVNDAVRNYYNHSSPDSKIFMDKIQKRFRCCGAANAGGDYIRRGLAQQPPCDVKYQRRPCLSAYFNYVADHFEEFMRDRLTVVGAVAVTISLCMIAGMVGVVFLWLAVRERRWSTHA